LIPRQGGKSLTWDVTVVSAVADSCLHSTSHSAGSVAETASVGKESKYSALPSDYVYLPIAFETVGPRTDHFFNYIRPLAPVCIPIYMVSQTPTSLLNQTASRLVQSLGLTVVTKTHTDHAACVTIVRMRCCLIILVITSMLLSSSRVTARVHRPFDECICFFMFYIGLRIVRLCFVSDILFYWLVDSFILIF